MKSWFLNLSLARKQIIVLLLAGLVPTIVVSLMAINIAGDQLEKQSFSQLESTRQIKASGISRYFLDVEAKLATMAQSSTTLAAMNAFSRKFGDLEKLSGEDTDIANLKQELLTYYEEQFGEEYKKRNGGETTDIASLFNSLAPETIQLQHAYIYDNPHPLGEKHLLDGSSNGLSYNSVHKFYHDYFRNFLIKFGFYDIFLIDAQKGNIVYSVFKELDYATSLVDGPYANSNFAEAFKKALTLKNGETILVDFERYLPSYNAPASFIASPVYRNDNIIGVIIFQIPIEPINEIMLERAGMGETGESYLVGSDYLMRSDSYLNPEQFSVSASFKHPETGSVKTTASEKALSGKSGAEIIIDYNGKPVLSSYGPIEIQGIRWAVLSEIDKKEAFAGIALLNRFLLIIASASALLIVFFALYISRILTLPVLKLSQTIFKVQRDGDFNVRCDVKQKDEIGQTSDAFNYLLENLSNAFNNVNEVLDEIGKGNCQIRINDSYSGSIASLVEGVNKTAEQIYEAQEAQQLATKEAETSAVEAEKAALEAEKQATETRIVKQALDVCDTSVTIVDENFDVIYLNNAFQKLLNSTINSFKRLNGQLTQENFIGSNLLCFNNARPDSVIFKKGQRETEENKLEFDGLTINIIATPIFDQQGNALGSVIEWVNMTEYLARQKTERLVAEENARIREALDNSSTSTMITDKKSKILYSNISARSLMGMEDQTNNKHLGNLFTAAQVEQLVKDAEQVQQHSISFNNLSLVVNTSPIFDSQHQLIGQVIEYRDRTNEVSIEDEIEELINEAKKGNFKNQLDLNNKDGFFHKISSDLNELLLTTATAVDEVVHLFAALSQGDLTQRIHNSYDGEFAQLKKDANSSIDKFVEVINKIGHSSNTIKSGSLEISGGTLDLSSRTEIQAKTLEHTASSMEQITAMVRSSEEKAKSADELAQRASDIAKKGSESVQQTDVAMHAIAESSDRIANIISVIDGIAFQTNLLALNAAVEAARAGEQGRGFAVVAAEVRNLAQRSAGAAKEIKELIVDSGNKVEDGSRLVENSRDTLNAIVSEVEQVRSMMVDIVSSAAEQTQGIEQINNSINQMDEMTQQNAALVEQASAASSAMSEQAAIMDNTVSFFKHSK